MKILLALIVVIAEYLGIATGLDFLTMGFPRFKKTKQEPPEEYMTQKWNHMDTQNGPSCSGYASAYVLRHLNIKADGAQLYKVMPEKMRKGAVHPRGVVKLLNRELQANSFPNGKKYRAEYCVGSIKQLKYEVSRGIPVIVFVKTKIHKRWLHFIPVVGYDKDFIYIAESLESNRNERTVHYNRKVPIAEFEKLWNTMLPEMPLIRNTYIAVREV